MTIGMDLTSLQGGHRMRGIGYTLIHLLNNVPPVIRANHTFVFFVYKPSAGEDPLELLNLTGFNYEVRIVQPSKKITSNLPWKLNFLMRSLKQVWSLSNLQSGDPRIKDTADIDVFLQTDQMISLPSGKMKKAFIAYDLIPYVLEWDYLWNYRTARLHALSRQAALRCSTRRWTYKHKLTINSRRADKIFAISDITAKDFTHHIPASGHKISTTPLGVDLPDDSSHKPAMHRYVDSSWGYVKRSYTFDNTPFILFVGGADKRRKLDDLVTAFNQVRAQGYKLKLVLAGDTLQGPKNIPTESAQEALATSSYIDDIVFMGFVDDQQRDWLYRHAQAFVFPSRYEGFGLPVLEAMSYGTPVIAYNNAATHEVASTVPLYANNHHELTLALLQILKQSANTEKQRTRGIKQARAFTWEKTADRIFEELLKA